MSDEEDCYLKEINDFNNILRFDGDCTKDDIDLDFDVDVSTCVANQVKNLFSQFVHS